MTYRTSHTVDHGPRRTALREIGVPVIHEASCPATQNEHFRTQRYSLVAASWSWWLRPQINALHSNLRRGASGACLGVLRLWWDVGENLILTYITNAFYWAFNLERKEIH